MNVQRGVEDTPAFQRGLNNTTTASGLAGSLELIAVENLVFQKAWHAAGHTAPPSYQGVEFDRMQDDPATAMDEAHQFEPHYDRHVWLYRENPAGVFAQFNPNVTCEHGTRPAAHAH